jgi:hypothetical protein
MRGAALCFAALCLSGCSTLLGFPPRIPVCEGALLPTQTLGPDFVARERLTVVHSDQTVRLDLVLQKRGAELVLIAFDPLGAKLFTVVQRGSETEIDAAPRPLLSVPPLNVLRDVHRARFAAPTDAELVAKGSETRIHNARCGTETTLVRVSERALP